MRGRAVKPSVRLALAFFCLLLLCPLARGAITFTEQPKSVTAPALSTVTFTCAANSDVPIVISWRTPKGPVQLGETLTFTAQAHYDGLQFACTAASADGSQLAQSQAATLTVSGRASSDTPDHLADDQKRVYYVAGGCFAGILIVTIMTIALYLHVKQAEQEQRKKEARKLASMAGASTMSMDPIMNPLHDDVSSSALEINPSFDGAAGEGPTGTMGPAFAEKYLNTRRKSKFTTVYRRPDTNPFDYDQTLSALQHVKVAFLAVTLLPIRVILLVLLFLLTSAIAFLSVVGLSEEQMQQPLSKPRKVIKSGLRLCVRAIPFVMGYYWINTKGKLAKPKDAPVMTIAPHSSFLDFFFVSAVALPFGVSRKENASIPLIGSIITATQPIFISRNDPDSRKNSINEMVRRAKTERGQWPHMMIFPEGTTTNRKCLVTFKNGAFIPGVPVQPVCLRYPNRYCDPAWVTGGPGAGKLFFLMMCQFVNYVTVEFLPVYTPTEQEVTDYKSFALNVRDQMANRLGVPVTSHTYDDVQLMQTAKRIRMPVNDAAVEFGKLQKVTGISVKEAKAIFKRFAKMQADDKSSDSKITYAQFCKGLGLPENELTEEVFNQLDRSDSGKIDFREYLIGVTLTSTDAGAVDTMDLAFKVFDRSGEGRVSKDDLYGILQTVFPQISKQDSDQLFAQVAKDGAGHITIEDYREFLKKHPEYALMMQSLRQQGYKPPGPAGEGGSTQEISVERSDSVLTN